jgi:hypothetical protein
MYTQYDETRNKREAEAKKRDERSARLKEKRTNKYANTYTHTRCNLGDCNKKSSTTKMSKATHRHTMKLG